MKKVKVYFVLLCLFIFTAGILSAQGTSHVYLLKMKVDKGKFIFDEPIRITQRDGYNNQPQFHPDGRSVLYSADADSNTDIYQYEIKTGKTRQLTSTPESEYSPTVMPGRDYFSVIQLFITEGPRKGAQPLMAFPFSGGKPETLYEDGNKVGYHAWINKDQVAMFILGSPNFLLIADLQKGKTTKAAENIGRSLYKIPGREAVSYSQNEENKTGMIFAYDLETKKSLLIISMKEGNDFYTWTPSGVLMMGVGPKLFKFDPKKDKNWQPIADLGAQGIKKITRLSVGPKGSWLAIVNNF